MLVAQPADAITKWGVRANAGNAHNGKVVTTLYNHPVRPASSGTLFAHGSSVRWSCLPQLPLLAP